MAWSLRGGVLEAGVNVRRFEVGEVLQNFRLRHAGGEHVEHILDPDAHPADAGASAALGGVDGDAVEEVHRRMSDIFMASWPGDVSPN